MTKENFTAIAVIADASSSMYPLAKETITNFNNFLNEQKENPAEAVFSLCVFSSKHNLVHDFVPLHSVEELTDQTYSCGGWTALLDAMGTTIDTLGTKLASMSEEERPSKVIVLVITDGEENASRRFTLDEIKAKVTHQREVYSWEFVFIGANIDAISTGTSMGFSAQNSVAYTPSAAGTGQLYRSVSSNLGSYRSSLAPKQVDFFGQTGVTPTSATVPAVSGDGTTVTGALISNQNSIVFDPGQAIPVPTTNK